MKYIIFLLLVMIQLSVVSQEVLHTLEPGVKRASQFYESLSFIHKTSVSKGYFVALAEENNVHFYLFDKNWKNLSQFKENREWVADQGIYQNYKQYVTKSNIFFSPDFQPVGSINTAEKEFIIAFLRNHKMYFQKVDFNTNKSTNLELWEPSNKAKILHTFTFNNKVYWIAYGKKNEDSIELNRFDSTGQIETKSISIRRSTSMDNIFRPGSSLIGSDFIDNEKQTDLLKASARIKFYSQNNSFFIVSDEFRGKTQITAVNLDNFEETNYSIEHKPANNFSLISSQNSFLLNENLLQINVCEETFTFTIHNLLTKQQASYSFNKDQEIAFKNSEVMQYGRSLFTPAERKLNKTSQFIRKVDGSGLSVIATLINDSIQVTMGSSQMIQTGGGSMYMPGGSISTPGGKVPLPHMWVSSDVYNTITRTIFFKSLFNRTDLHHLNSPLSLDGKTKRVDEFYDKKTNHTVNPVIEGTDVIAGYLDRDTRKFFIVRF